MSCILITGGFGYIGSHTATILSENNKKFVIVDNFSNCKREIVDRLKMCTNDNVAHYECDIRDTKSLVKIIKENNPGICLETQCVYFKNVPRNQSIRAIEHYQIFIKLDS